MENRGHNVGPPHPMGSHDPPAGYQMQGGGGYGPTGPQGPGPGMHRLRMQRYGMHHQMAPQMQQMKMQQQGMMGYDNCGNGMQGYHYNRMQNEYMASQYKQNMMSQQNFSPPNQNHMYMQRMRGQMHMEMGQMGYQYQRGNQMMQGQNMGQMMHQNTPQSPMVPHGQMNRPMTHMQQQQHVNTNMHQYRANNNAPNTGLMGLNSQYIGSPPPQQHMMSPPHQGMIKQQYGHGVNMMSPNSQQNMNYPQQQQNVMGQNSVNQQQMMQQQSATNPASQLPDFRTFATMGQVQTTPPQGRMTMHGVPSAPRRAPTPQIMSPPHMPMHSPNMVSPKVYMNPMASPGSQHSLQSPPPLSHPSTSPINTQLSTMHPQGYRPDSIAVSLPPTLPCTLNSNISTVSHIPSQTSINTHTSTMTLPTSVAQTQIPTSSSPYTTASITMTTSCVDTLPHVTHVVTCHATVMSTSTVMSSRVKMESCDKAMRSPEDKKLHIKTTVESISVPFGWKRIVEAGAVVYYSPSGVRLASVEHIQQYLQTEGTCKCGLECPILVERVFSFDPQVASRAWRTPEDHMSPSSDLTKLCNHKRKTMAMATLQNSQKNMEGESHKRGTPDGKRPLSPASADIKNKVCKRQVKQKAEDVIYDNTLLAKLMEGKQEGRQQQPSHRFYPDHMEGKMDPSRMAQMKMDHMKIEQKMDPMMNPLHKMEMLVDGAMQQEHSHMDRMMNGPHFQHEHMVGPQGHSHQGPNAHGHHPQGHPQGPHLHQGPHAQGPHLHPVHHPQGPHTHQGPQGHQYPRPHGPYPPHMQQQYKISQEHQNLANMPPGYPPMNPHGHPMMQEDMGPHVGPQMVNRIQGPMGPMLSPGTTMSQDPWACPTDFERKRRKISRKKTATPQNKIPSIWDRIPSCPNVDVRTMAKGGPLEQRNLDPEMIAHMQQFGIPSEEIEQHFRPSRTPSAGSCKSVGLEKASPRPASCQLSPGSTRSTPKHSARNTPISSIMASLNNAGIMSRSEEASEGMLSFLSSGERQLQVNCATSNKPHISINTYLPEGAVNSIFSAVVSPKAKQLTSPSPKKCPPNGLEGAAEPLRSSYLQSLFGQRSPNYPVNSLTGTKKFGQEDIEREIVERKVVNGASTPGSLSPPTKSPNLNVQVPSTFDENVLSHNAQIQNQNVKMQSIQNQNVQSHNTLTQNTPSVTISHPGAMNLSNLTMMNASGGGTDITTVLTSSTNASTVCTSTTTNASTCHPKEKTPIQMVQNMITGLEATQNAIAACLANATAEEEHLKHRRHKLYENSEHRTNPSSSDAASTSTEPYDKLLADGLTRTELSSVNETEKLTHDVNTVSQTETEDCAIDSVKTGSIDCLTEGNTSESNRNLVESANSVTDKMNELYDNEVAGPSNTNNDNLQGSVPETVAENTVDTESAETEITETNVNEAMECVESASEQYHLSTETGVVPAVSESDVAQLSTEMDSDVVNSDAELTRENMLAQVSSEGVEIAASSVGLQSFSVATEAMATFTSTELTLNPDITVTTSTVLPGVTMPHMLSQLPMLQMEGGFGVPLMFSPPLPVTSVSNISQVSPQGRLMSPLSGKLGMLTSIFQPNLAMLQNLMQTSHSNLSQVLTQLQVNCMLQGQMFQQLVVQDHQHTDELQSEVQQPEGRREGDRRRGKGRKRDRRKCNVTTIASMLSQQGEVQDGPSQLTPPIDPSQWNLSCEQVAALTMNMNLIQMMTLNPSVALDPNFVQTFQQTLHTLQTQAMQHPQSALHMLQAMNYMQQHLSPFLGAAGNFAMLQQQNAAFLQQFTAAQEPGEILAPVLPSLNTSADTEGSDTMSMSSGARSPGAALNESFTSVSSKGHSPRSDKSRSPRRSDHSHTSPTSHSPRRQRSPRADKIPDPSSQTSDADTIPNPANLTEAVTSVVRAQKLNVFGEYLDQDTDVQKSSYCQTLKTYQVLKTDKSHLESAQHNPPITDACIIPISSTTKVSPKSKTRLKCEPNPEDLHTEITVENIELHLRTQREEPVPSKLLQLPETSHLQDTHSSEISNSEENVVCEDVDEQEAIMEDAIPLTHTGIGLDVHLENTDTQDSQATECNLPDSEDTIDNIENDPVEASSSEQHRGDVNNSETTLNLRNSPKNNSSLEVLETGARVNHTDSEMAETEETMEEKCNKSSGISSPTAKRKRGTAKMSRAEVAPVEEKPDVMQAPVENEEGTSSAENSQDSTEVEMSSLAESTSEVEDGKMSPINTVAECEGQFPEITEVKPDWNDSSPKSKAKSPNKVSPVNKVAKSEDRKEPESSVAYKLPGVRPFMPKSVGRLGSNKRSGEPLNGIVSRLKRNAEKTAALEKTVAAAKANALAKETPSDGKVTDSTTSIKDVMKMNGPKDTLKVAKDGKDSRNSTKDGIIRDKQITNVKDADNANDVEGHEPKVGKGTDTNDHDAKSTRSKDTIDKEGRGTSRVLNCISTNKQAQQKRKDKESILEEKLKIGEKEVDGAMTEMQPKGMKRHLDDEEEPECSHGETTDDEANSIDDSPLEERTPRHFDIGDLVWGPLRGFPSWPGKLVHESEVKGNPKSEDGKVWVRWFGEHSFTQVAPEQLKTLTEGLDAHHNARQNHRKGRKIQPTLEEAIMEAMNELDKQTASPQNENKSTIAKVAPTPARVAPTPTKVAPPPAKVAPTPNKTSPTNKVPLTANSPEDKNNKTPKSAKKRRTR